MIGTGRRRAAVALHEALACGPGSEREVAERWVNGMRAAGVTTFWYVPPPNGTTVLSGSCGFGRLGLQSFRPEHAWPEDLPVTEEPATFYTSPVSSSGIIEDFGLTLYRGDRQEVRDHIQDVANLVAELTEFVEPGMCYADLYREARDRWEAAGLRNDIASSTDAAGTNIGHSIPFFGGGHDKRDRATVAPELISKARMFVSAANTELVADTCAFTIEPRLGAPGLPVAWFHVVVTFVAGRKRVLTEFGPVFRLPGLEWFSNPWTRGEFDGS